MKRLQTVLYHANCVHIMQYHDHLKVHKKMNILYTLIDTIRLEVISKTLFENFQFWLFFIIVAKICKNHKVTIELV